jgi:hypothetical protein
MRRPEREIKDQGTITGMLEKAAVGRLATVNRRGYPVIKPVNFLYADGRIYFHSSLKGEKIRDIRRGSPVCFEIDEPVGYVATNGPACKASYYYRSVVAKGKALLLKDRRRKMSILQKLMEKYQPEGGYREISEGILKKTAVVEITPVKITGKENLG